MATAAGSTSQEYWRPSNPDVARVVTSIWGTCRLCGTDYPAGARYCNLCGAARNLREDEFGVKSDSLYQETRPKLISRTLGLSLPCVVIFVMAILFALAAALTGVIYREDTLVDWQAVQVWRIEWLLAAIAALLAGILLKKTTGST